GRLDHSAHGQEPRDRRGREPMPARRPLRCSDQLVEESLIDQGPARRGVRLGAQSREYRAPLQLLRGGAAQRLREGFEARRQLELDFEPPPIDASDLPGPAPEAVCPCLASESGHAVEGHRLLIAARSIHRKTGPAETSYFRSGTVW